MQPHEIKEFIDSYNLTDNFLWMFDRKLELMVKEAYQQGHKAGASEQAAKYKPAAVVAQTEYRFLLNGSTFMGRPYTYDDERLGLMYTDERILFTLTG